MGAAAAAAPVHILEASPSASATSPTRPRVRLAVSTYSYWHFKAEKYPVEKVIEHAADLGFDGVEILHRQMADESPAYVNRLKKAAFRNSLDLVMLSIHQDFVSPDAGGASRSSTRCIASTSRPSSGSPASGSIPAGGRRSSRSTT